VRGMRKITHFWHHRPGGRKRSSCGLRKWVAMRRNTEDTQGVASFFASRTVNWGSETEAVGMQQGGKGLHGKGGVRDGRI